MKKFQPYFKEVFILYVFVCAQECMYVHHVYSGACEVRKIINFPRAGVAEVIWVLGLEPRFPARTVKAL